jgi:hypothetical protein
MVLHNASRDAGGDYFCWRGVEIRNKPEGQ